VREKEAEGQAQAGPRGAIEWASLRGRGQEKRAKKRGGCEMGSALGKRALGHCYNEKRVAYERDWARTRPPG